MIGKKFGENAVIMEEFTRYFYDELESEEEVSYYEGMGESHIQSPFPAFSYGMPPCYSPQEDEGLFQMQGRIVHDGSAGFFWNPVGQERQRTAFFSPGKPGSVLILWERKGKSATLCAVPGMALSVRKLGQRRQFGGFLTEVEGILAG